MVTQTRKCRYCGEPFEYQTGWGKGFPPRTCPKHRGQYGDLTQCAVRGCEERFVKVQGTHTANCPNHRGWFKGKPRGLQKPAKAKGYCGTCGAEFEKPNGKSRYCCDDHNPGLLSTEELVELAQLFRPTLDWPTKYQRYIK